MLGPSFALPFALSLVLSALVLGCDSPPPLSARTTAPPQSVAAATAPGAGDIQVIATNGGQTVPELPPLLAAGKVTVVDFFGPWCHPCKLVDAHMNEIIAARTDVAYRKLDVGDGDSPLAKRYLRGVENLPFVIVFDRAGHEVERISGYDLRKLDAAIATAAGT